MSIIQSATGPLDTANMGFTLMHEHVLVLWPPMYQQYPELFDRASQMENAVARLTKAREAGVRTMVDLTPIDLGRDPAFIAEASRRSGMQIIVATGLYYQVPFYFHHRPDQEMVDLFVRDITTGIGRSGVRANVIKCATEPEMHPMNERVLRASAKAHRATGVPICTHTYAAGRTGLDQIRVFKEEGVDLSRVVIGHSDDSDDLSYLEQIVQSGATCGMDRIGLPAPRTSEQRADMISALIEKGHADRITVSHDASCHIDMIPPGIADTVLPRWNYTHIPLDVIPMLRERGVSEADIRKLTVDNPRRLFEQNQPY
ncbi:MAG: phosphotriesterase-related protein [Dehalococcoidia bacterium]|nr:phosphotriesterase-related protein [Chloroflexi bacterium CFX7]NUQ56334.1 phosphotriesterase-related protein [Dehalococcoidia bacterium]RIL02666.1 MAG: phosphotriesterase-related protein [bacterium]